MCHQCNYSHLLEVAGLSATRKRLGVLEVIGNNNYPLNVQEIFEILNRNEEINRVTIYRILDLLVAKGLVDRIRGGGRSYYYGLAPNENHQPHPHFYCTNCGNMECLNPKSFHLDTTPLEKTFPGQIENVEVHINGICKSCLKIYKSEHHHGIKKIR